MKPILFVAFALLSSINVFGQDSLNISCLYHWNDTTIRTFNVDYTHNEVWGFVQDGREYAILGSAHGAYFFDVTNPSTASMIDFISGVSDSVIHRDYHDYKGFLYMVSDEIRDEATLQIVDLSYLPDSVHLIYDSNELISNVHNIFIDTSSGVLYTTAADIIKLDENFPDQPEYIAQVVEGEQGGHDLYVRNDTVYWNQSFGRILISKYDQADPLNPKTIGILENYEDKGYNHSGWLSEDGLIYAFCDETPGLGIKICDASNPSDLEVLAVTDPVIDTTSTPHNVMIKDGFMYVSYYKDGFYLYDIRKPSSPKIVGYYDTYPDSTTASYPFFGAWGVYAFLPSGNVLISDTKYGLFVLDMPDDLGINTQKTGYDVTVFPNPASEYLTIDCESKSNDLSWKIYTITGELVLFGGFDRHNRTTISVSKLNGGSYLLGINDNERYEFQKIVIN